MENVSMIEFPNMVNDEDFHLAPEIRNSGNCGFQLTGLKPGDKGVIQTPNYPENYPPDIQCIWWMKVVCNPKSCALSHI